MSPEEAEEYHALQAGAFAAAGADMLTAVTMTYAEEATGVARAAAAAGLPCAISFTVETDGRLPSGQGLGDAIAQVDAATGSGPAYYMVNCAHPSHFTHVVDGLGETAGRVGGLRVNASSKSHAELDAATELDEGDPAALRDEHAELLAHLPNVTVIGGCCGTDARHVASAGAAWGLGSGSSSS
jgi:homocysteine S-methyltransferase